MVTYCLWENYITRKCDTSQTVLMSERYRPCVRRWNTHTLHCGRNFAVTIVNIKQVDLKAKQKQERKLGLTQQHQLLFFSILFQPDCQLLSLRERGTIPHLRTWQHRRLLSFAPMKIIIREKVDYNNFVQKTIPFFGT